MFLLSNRYIYEEDLNASKDEQHMLDGVVHNFNSSTGKSGAGGSL